MTHQPTDSSELTAVAIVCTLKPSPSSSSSELIARQVLDQLSEHGVGGAIVRAVDLDIRPGVEADMGDGDEWPSLRQQILDADILVLSTPTWMGQMSSVAQRVLERLDAELSNRDEQGRPVTFGKVAIVAVVGNEDGAHAISAAAFQGLGDVGYTIPAQGATYWNGEAMHGTDYQDLEQTPEATATTTRTAALNAAHLAGVLRANRYPAG